MDIIMMSTLGNVDMGEGKKKLNDMEFVFA